VQLLAFLFPTEEEAEVATPMAGTPAP
jgi:hypothetical protein